jgi:hypothetical protein
MTLRLPETYYRPIRERQHKRRSFTLAAVLAVFIAGWQLFSLPGALIKRYDPPVDMPWYGFGLAGVFVEQDGRWVIHREGYADRKRKYVITPSGALEKFDDSGVYDPKLDTSGSKGRGTQLPGGGVLNLKPSHHFYGWLRDVRAGGSETEADAKLSAGVKPGAVGAGTAAPLPQYGESLADAQASTPYVILRVYINSKPTEYRVLAGYHYFPVYDSVCYSAPWLWLTTDKVRFIHKIYLDDSAGTAKIREELSLPFDPGAKIDHDTSMGLDKRVGRLYVLTSSGRRFWFDPLTLQQQQPDKLPGVWLAEYACLGDPRPDYSFDRGYPLTQGQYQFLLRSLVIIFLGSLLYLAVQWRHAWRFIAAATTGALSSSSSSSPTSADSDTPA